VLTEDGSTGSLDCKSECRETLEVEHDKFNACGEENRDLEEHSDQRIF